MQELPLVIHKPHLHLMCAQGNEREARRRPAEFRFGNPKDRQVLRAAAGDDQGQVARLQMLQVVVVPAKIRLHTVLLQQRQQLHRP